MEMKRKEYGHRGTLARMAPHKSLPRHPLALPLADAFSSCLLLLHPVRQHMISRVLGQGYQPVMMVHPNTWSTVGEFSSPPVVFAFLLSLPFPQPLHSIV